MSPSALFRRPLFVPALLLAVFACGPAEEPPAGEVVVSAAASLRDAILEIGELYADATPVELVPNFAGSNELARQILASPQADVYLSANEKWMDEVEAAGRLVADSRVALLSNRLVVIVRTDSPYEVAEAGDLETLPYRHLVLANPDSVPAGIYSRQWLESRGLWQAVEDRVAPALDVRAALGLVETDPELIGIVYRTDAASSDEVEVSYEVPADEGPRIVYAAAALAGGPNPENGLAFMEYVQGAEAAAAFERHGFVVGDGSAATANGVSADGDRTGDEGAATAGDG